MAEQHISRKAQRKAFNPRARKQRGVFRKTGYGTYSYTPAVKVKDDFPGA